MADHDTHLMLRAATGDEEAFAELFERHYARAVNIAYRSTGDRDLAEDIAMDAFARIYESRASFRASAKFTTYLYRVVVNLTINAAKRSRIVRQDPLEDGVLAAPAAADPSAQAERAEVARVVRDAVLALPPNQRLALILTRYEGMSYESAAEAMRVSVKAVESLLHRAKANLREALRDCVGFGCPRMNTDSHG